ncbi:MAG: hypothetical protein V4733_03580 [Verrucomicrobiota bacterium]
MASAIGGYIDGLKRDRERYREALDRIARPIWWMQEDQRRATGSINGVNAAMAISLAESANYLRGIAEKALSPENARHLAAANDGPNPT